MLAVIAIVPIDRYCAVFFGSCGYRFGKRCTIHIIGGIIGSFINGAELSNDYRVALGNKFIIH
ncbi:hypothetical protein D3C75_1342470 [compost metagenome]